MSGCIILVLVTVTECAYCAVWAECLTVILINLSLQICATAQAVGQSGWVSWCTKCTWDRFFSQYFGPPVLRSRLHLHIAVTRRTSGRSLWTFQKAMLFCFVVESSVISRRYTYICIWNSYFCTAPKASHDLHSPLQELNLRTFDWLCSICVSLHVTNYAMCPGDSH